MYLSVIIPAYNEEKRIGKTIAEISDYLSKQPFDYEIIVVNDGSIDKTQEIVRNLKLNIPNLEIIDNEKNKGKGYTVRKGLLKGKGKYRLFTDADNSTSIEEIEKFFPYLNNYDIIIGSRSIKGSIITNPQPFYRKILGRFYGLLVWLIIGLWNIRDTQCGFKLFSAKSVEDIFLKCQISGWSFDVEILVLAKKFGYKIKEVPIIWADQSQTKVRFKGMVKAIFDLLKIRWNLIVGRYRKKS